MKNKTIKEWQKIIMSGVEHKYSNSVRKTQLDRVQFINEQLEDVKNALLVEQGLLQSDDHAHQDSNHRIAALMADVLVLAEMRNFDLEKELKNVSKWYEN